MNYLHGRVFCLTNVLITSSALQSFHIILVMVDTQNNCAPKCLSVIQGKKYYLMKFQCGCQIFTDLTSRSRHLIVAAALSHKAQSGMEPTCLNEKNQQTVTKS